MSGQINTDVDDFSKALESVFQGSATVLYRMRLSCGFSDKDGNTIGKEGEGIRIHARYRNMMAQPPPRLASHE